MDFNYRPSKWGTDYKVSGVITELHTEHLLSVNGTDEVAFGLVLTTFDRKPKKLYFKIIPNTINDSILEESKSFTVNFWIESREYNGKWYTNLYTNDVEVYDESK